MEKSQAILTQEEEIERIFSKFDSNGDGKISSTELAAVLNGLGSTTPSDEVSRIMSELDADGDGFIDIHEFKKFHLSTTNTNPADANTELKEAFDLYDKDGNGKISANELHSVLHSLGEKCSIKDCRKMISSVDVDGDGCVNFEEFKKMMTRS